MIAGVSGMALLYPIAGIQQILDVDFRQRIRWRAGDFRW
jgi:hypothetical protein